MYHKAEYKYECRQPWEPWAIWDNPDSYVYESGFAPLSLSLLPITLRFIVRTEFLTKLKILLTLTLIIILKIFRLEFRLPVISNVTHIRFSSKMIHSYLNHPEIFTSISQIRAKNKKYIQRDFQSILFINHYYIARFLFLTNRFHITAFFAKLCNFCNVVQFWC